jgi:GNAT superfamily N-acetyltransferase
MKSEIEIKEYRKGDYIISNDQDKLQINVIHGYLTRSYWSKDIAYNTVKSSVDNSYCFGLYSGEVQVGFARLITDYTTFAYLADVFVLEEHRGKGLSKWLMEVILNSDELQGLRNWMLKTRDAHGLYKKFGFDQLKFPERMMEYSPLKKD